MSKQPEALRLADLLEINGLYDSSNELRRLGGVDVNDRTIFRRRLESRNIREGSNVESIRRT